MTVPEYDPHGPTQVAGWCYGWNRPGYMPDAVEWCETWQEARDALVWEMERTDCGEPDEPEGWIMTEAQGDHAIATLMGATPDQPLDVVAGRYVYFLIEGDAEQRD